MLVDIIARRSALLWSISLLLDGLADMYYAEDEDEQRELLKQMREIISKLEKGKTL